VAATLEHEVAAVGPRRRELPALGAEPVEPALRVLVGLRRLFDAVLPLGAGKLLEERPAAETRQSSTATLDCDRPEELEDLVANLVRAAFRSSRIRAAGPSFSRTSPSRMCSVPM
jgi:hypothetical protein